MNRASRPRIKEKAYRRRLMLSKVLTFSGMRLAAICLVALFAYLFSHHLPFRADKWGKGAISSTYEFDEEGKLVELVDESGQETKYKYDKRALIKSMNFSDGTVQYGYDDNGNQNWTMDD